MSIRKTKTRKVAEAMKALEKKNFPSDVDGSYTGETYDGEPPIQDADDL